MKISNGSLLIDKQNFYIIVDHADSDNVTYTIKHENWNTLFGKGFSLNDAIEGLQSCISYLAPIYKNMDDSLLSREGVNMKEWLQSIEEQL